jgi:hypothetical protein
MEKSQVLSKKGACILSLHFKKFFKCKLIFRDGKHWQLPEYTGRRKDYKDAEENLQGR